MAVEILMPALSPTMTEGNLAKWLKKEGDSISAGDVIAEIETDKAVMEVEAVDEGVLAKVLVPEKTQGVKVNQLIAVLKEDGDSDKDVEELVSKFANNNAQAAKKESDSAKEPEPAAPSSPAAVAPTAHGGRVFASPLAKRIAGQEGVDIAAIAGSGPKGRVIKADVLAAKGQGGAASAGFAMPATTSMAAGRNAQESIAEPHSTMRQVIAKRLLESKQKVPHFYLTQDIRLDKLMAERAQINAAAPLDKEGKPAYKISVNDLVIKAVACCLRDHPEVNSAWTDEAMLRYTNVDVSVAVAIDGGLITPIVKNADQKGIITISQEMKQLAQRAKKNQLAPEEFQGGGFSISNLGMYGMKDFKAIINPPQSSILAIGAGEERPVVVNGELKVGIVMTVSLSCDHRVVDGAAAAEFMASFKKYMETPILMLV
jgi:pyruvate dehydrogenase E2 component (dihydrolipoamide acetyltransferase)